VVLDRVGAYEADIVVIVVGVGVVSFSLWLWLCRPAEGFFGSWRELWLVVVLLFWPAGVLVVPATTPAAVPSTVWPSTVATAPAAPRTISSAATTTAVAA
jgi:hypothetical protein